MERLHIDEENDGTSFGQKLVPALDGAKALGETLDLFDRNEVAAKALGVVVGGVLATAVGVFTYGKLADLAKGIKGIYSDVSVLTSKLAGIELPGASTPSSTAIAAATSDTAGRTTRSKVPSAPVEPKRPRPSKERHRRRGVRCRCDQGRFGEWWHRGRDRGRRREETGALWAASTLAGGEELGATAGASTLAGGEDDGALMPLANWRR